MRLASCLVALLLLMATASASVVTDASDALDVVADAAAPVSSFVPASLEAHATVGSGTVDASAGAEGASVLDVGLAPALPSVPDGLLGAALPPLLASVSFSTATLPTLVRPVGDVERQPRGGTLTLRGDPFVPPPAADVEIVSLVEPAPSGPAPEPPLGALPIAGPEAPLDASSEIATLALATTAVLGALASLYSRFQKHTLLRSDARARIHAKVSQAPGATLAELRAETGLSRNALVHHCHLLEKHGLLASRHDGLHRRFYPPGQRPRDERPPTPKEARLLHLVREHGPLTQAELASLLGVSRQAVHEQVKRLQASQRLVPQEAAGERRWVPAAEPASSPPAPVAEG